MPGYERTESKCDFELWNSSLISVSSFECEENLNSSAQVWYPGPPEMEVEPEKRNQI